MLEIDNIEGLLPADSVHLNYVTIFSFYFVFLEFKAAFRDKGFNCLFIDIRSQHSNRREVIFFKKLFFEQN